MSQVRLYCLQAAWRAAGSAVTQRGDDVVSGRMMPTFAPLPLTEPPVDDDEDDDDVVVDEVFPPAGDDGAEADVLDVPPPLEPQAASAKAATIPTAATGTLLLRMQ